MAGKDQLSFGQLVLLLLLVLDLFPSEDEDDERAQGTGNEYCPEELTSFTLLFPAPDWSVDRIDQLAAVLETALLQDPR